MQCQVCGKNNATVHFTEIVNGKMSEFHVCEPCAQQKGIQGFTSKGKFWIADLVAGMLDEAPGAESERVGHVQCAGCGMLYSSFRENGRLGCATCYESFSTQLRPVLRRIHGATRHVGKAPVRDGERMAQRAASLQIQQDLERAIEAEDFERAAELRDRLRASQVVTTPPESP